MGADTYISYDAFKSAVHQLDKTGVAPCVILPFAARQGQVVNIGGREYRLSAPVTEDSEKACGRTMGDDGIVGFRVEQL